MDQLVEQVVRIGSDLDLNATLQRIVTAARELTGARYGALGVRGPDGGLVSFLHSGIDAESVSRMGSLPAGRGLLGALLTCSEPLRLGDMTAHAEAGGFPEHHPPMRAFLGLPITVGGEVFGSLYLTDDREGWTFSEADEVTVQALATAAGVSIENAALYEREATSARWLKASREILTALLTGTEAPLRLVAERVRELAEAEQAIVLVPVESDDPSGEVTTLMVATAVGEHTEGVLHQQVPVYGSTAGGVFASGEPVITDRFAHPIAGFTDVGQRPAIVVPLRAGDAMLGVITVARNQYRPSFAPGYLDIVADFATHAAIALTLATARARDREMTVLADRERIAHDLHDHVIQKLFAAGMALQGTVARARSPEVVQRLTATIDDLQGVIEDIRSTIFGLQTNSAAAQSFRRRIQGAVSTLTADSDLATTVQLSGPLTIVDSSLADHAEAVVTEAVSNAVRHSGATKLTVHVAVADYLSVDVVDNGNGIPADNRRRSGLANMARRADQLGGTCSVTAADEVGTHVHWSVPLLGA